MELKEIIPKEFFSFVRFSAIAGFLATTTLIINLNHKAFGTIFKDRAKSYWWLFVILSVIPLVLFLYFFNLFFMRLGVYLK